MKKLILKVIGRIANYLPAYTIIPPYNYVQNVVEYNLERYLDKDASDIKQLCIVGGYKGNEIPRLLRNYANCEITVFEPSMRYVAILEKRVSGSGRVRVVNKAASDSAGKARFYETNIKGSGSLLEVGSLAKESYGMDAAEDYEVDVTTLDVEMSDVALDCLWIDVQGAEMLVLNGARNLLNRTNSVFVEVSVNPDLYVGGVLKQDLEKLLFDYGFQPYLVGLDRENLTGNAFYVKQSPAAV